MRRLGTIAVVVVALLVVTATPASAAVVYDQHSTAAEFNGAAALSNVTVTGSGPAANVDLAERDNTIDSFEDADLSEYSGSTGQWTTSFVDFTDGSTSLRASAGNPGRIVSTSGLSRYYNFTGNYTADVKLNGVDHNATVGFGAASIDDYFGVRVNTTGAQFITRDTGVGGDLNAFKSSTGTIPHDRWLTVDVYPTNDDNSNFTISVSDQADGTVYTELVVDDELIIQPDGEGIAFEANQSDVAFDYARVTNTTLSKRSKGTYVSQNYTVSDLEDGWANLTLANATAHVTWQGTNGNQWQDVASATYTTTGNRTQSLVGADYTEWRVNVTFVRDPGPTTAQLHDEGVRTRDENLNIWNESAPNQAVTDPANATFYGTDEFVGSSTTTTGSVDITTLPTNQSYVVRVRAEGWVSRRLYIDDPTAEQEIYLLPENVTTVDIVYTLDDNTGRYPPRETTLKVQRALERNGDTRYRTITSDTFGATNEFAVTLEEDIRYRLVVESEQGGTRVLGGYIATADDPNAVLPIGEVNPTGSTSEDIGFAASLEESPRRVVATYRDPLEATTELYLNVTNAETGTSIRANTSVPGSPHGTYQETIMIPGSEPANASYIVEYTAVRNGSVRQGDRRVGSVGEFLTVFELGPNVAMLVGWGTVIALMGLTAIVSVPLAALVGPAAATVLTWGGLIDVPLVLLAGAGTIGLLAAVVGYDR
jgi:hypothetical protein